MAPKPPLPNKKPSQRAQEKMQKILDGADATIPSSIQQELNKPLQTSGVSAEDHEFLNIVVEKVENGQIDLMNPESLIHHAVYDTLDEMAQGKADYDAVRLLPKLREIYQLHESGDTETYQFENLVHSIRLLKEGIEQVAGDIFIV